MTAGRELGLFRPEVDGSKRGKYSAELRIESTRYTVAATCVAAGTIVGFLVLAFLGSYSSHRNIRGRFEPIHGFVDVTAPHSGVVGRLLVAEGDHVEANQALAEVESDVSASIGGNSREAISNQLWREQRDIEARLKDIDRLATIDQASGASQVSMLKQEREHVAAQVRLIDQQISSADAMLTKMASLIERGYISQYQVEQQRAQVLALRSSRELTLQQYVALAAKLSAAQSQLPSLSLQAEKERSDLRTQLSEIKSRAIENESQRKILIRAPVAGVVTAMLAKPAKSVEAGENLLSIAPRNAQLVGVFYVSSEVVPFVHVGDMVGLKVDAFPYQIYGLLRGRVRSLSRSPISPSDLKGVAYDGLEKPLYRLTIDPLSSSIKRANREYQLRAGLSSQTELALERHKIYQWALFRSDAEEARQ